MIRVFSIVCRRKYSDEMDYLNLFYPNAIFKRKILPGPSSRRQLPKDMSLLDAKLNMNIKHTESGTDYVKEYVQREEDELLEVY